MVKLSLRWSCVEFPQVQFIDWREIVHVLKAVTVVTSVRLNNLSMIFVVSHFLIAKVSPKWRLNPGFGIQKKCSFPLVNRGVPSIEVANTKIMSTFLRDKVLCPLNRGVSWLKVSQRRGFTVILSSQGATRSRPLCSVSCHVTGVVMWPDEFSILKKTTWRSEKIHLLSTEKIYFCIKDPETKTFRQQIN